MVYVVLSRKGRGESLTSVSPFAVVLPEAGTSALDGAVRSCKGVGVLFPMKGLGLGLKVPRPHSDKADQAPWAKDFPVMACDEMRFGRWGQVRRRWGLKGKKIIQPMQIVFRWSGAGGGRGAG